jgi:hypothetical protein
MKLDELCIANGQQLNAHAELKDEFVSYFINDELYMCIRAAPAVYNGEFDIVENS